MATKKQSPEFIGHLDQDIWSIVLAYSDIPTSQKFVLSRAFKEMGLRALNPNQLIKAYEVYAREYRTARENNDQVATDNALERLTRILEVLTDIAPSKGLPIKMQRKIFVITGENFVYPMFRKLFKEFGFDAKTIGYPAHAYGATVADVSGAIAETITDPKKAATIIADAKKYIKAFEAKYPELGSSSLGGAVGQVASRITDPTFTVRQN